ncbi:MAG: MraY family glycosyltransferase [Polyangiaceae bacterium]
MRSAIATFIAAIAITALLTPAVRRAALAAGAVDEPGARRVHARRVPRMGGIAIVFGFFAPLLALFALHTGAALLFFANLRITLGLIVGAGLVVGIGLLDDIRVVGAKQKLGVQTAAALVAYACGMRIEAIYLPWLGAIHLGWLALPATIAWVVGIVNAINLIDGLDGLAAGVCFFACLTNFAISLLTGNVFIQLITASLGGALVGFLFHNFNPARIFMGDSGSMFLGFILGCSSLLGAGTQKSPTLIGIMVPVLALGLPITDLLLTVVRRFVARRSLFSADRGHIHHRLLDRGLTHRRAVLALYLLSITFTVLALIVYFGRSWEIGAALFAVTALLVGIVRFVGYFNPSLTAIGRFAGDEHAEILRRSVPPLLRAIEGTLPKQLPTVLAEFGESSGLVAIGIVDLRRPHVRPWRWETPRSQHRQVQDAACSKFCVGADQMELQFFLDTETGVVGPQTRMLLQLVADVVEPVLGSAESAEVSETSALARTGTDRIVRQAT